MIAFLEGNLVHLDPTSALINVQGVGYEVRISLQTFQQIKGQDKVHLLTYLSIKEDAHTLFGFYEMEEKSFFLDLISISGVGASTALMVLSSLSTAEAKNAIVREDVRVIQGIKGIGAKTAQRIILELKDKLKKEGLIAHSTNNSLNSQNGIRAEAIAAMVALGYIKVNAEKVVDQILKLNGDNFTVEQLIKQALKSS